MASCWPQRLLVLALLAGAAVRCGYSGQPSSCLPLYPCRRHPTDIDEATYKAFKDKAIALYASVIGKMLSAQPLACGERLEMTAGTAAAVTAADVTACLGSGDDEGRMFNGCDMPQHMRCRTYT